MHTIAPGQGVGHLELLAAVAAGRWHEVVLHAAPTYSTRSTIFVDEGLDEVDRRHAVLVQAALLGAGSLDIAWQHRLRHGGGKTRVAERFVVVEAPRALRERGHVLPGLTEIADSLGRDWPRTDTSIDSLLVARSRGELPELPAWFGHLAPSVPAMDQSAVSNKQDERADDDPAALTATALNEHASDLAGLLAKFTLGIEEGRVRRFFRRTRRVPGASAASVGSGPTGSSRVHARRDGPIPALTWRRSRDGDAVPVIGGVSGKTRRRASKMRYPEYDGDNRVLRADWCTVYDRDQVESTDAQPERTIADRALRRRLAPVVLKPTASRRRSDGDELDVDAVIDAYVRRVATGDFDDRVWLSPRRGRPDLSVLILLDLSGSVSGSSHGASTHQRQLELTEVIADALDALGARVGLYGFRSHGRHNIEMIRVAAFDTGVDSAARRRLRACTPTGFTRIGAAVRRSTDLIDQDGGTSRRLLLVVCDGVAYDSGYEGAQAEADTRLALAAARARGIGTLCVTVGADTDADALARLFGPRASVRVRAVGDLRDHLAAMIRYALRDAARTSANRL